MIDFDQAQTYIAKENPFAAQAMAERIVQASRRLCDSPEIGAPGLEHGTRHWIVGRTPYMLVYRIRDDSIEILRVWHGRRNWTAGVEDLPLRLSSTG